MWKLKRRDDKISPYAELGAFEDIAHAAQAILDLENDPNGAIYFRLDVDPLMAPTDAEIFAELQYQSPRYFYLLTRSKQ